MIRFYIVLPFLLSSSLCTRKSLDLLISPCVSGGSDGFASTPVVGLPPERRPLLRVFKKDLKQKKNKNQKKLSHVISLVYSGMLFNNNLHTKRQITD